LRPALEIYALRPFFPKFSINNLRLKPNLLDFIPDLDGLYALHHKPNFFEIHPSSDGKFLLKDKRYSKLRTFSYLI
jgi:hypothetical protein